MRFSGGGGEIQHYFFLLDVFRVLEVDRQELHRIHMQEHEV